MTTAIAITFKDQESKDFWEYATGQGSLFTWSDGEQPLTVTASAADQPDADALEDFHDNWDAFDPADDPEWATEMGVVTVTVTA